MHDAYRKDGIKRVCRCVTQRERAWSVRCVGWADWVDCRCFLSFVFLGDVRRLELSPCNSQRERQRPGNAMERKSIRQAEVMKIEQNTAIVAT